MLDFIYTLLIAPLEYWMHAALVWGYAHTQDWGWAIVVMSLAVNTVILPIYIKAESWQEHERALRKSFEAKQDMIKRTFKGQERFAMISTLYRQAGYSPLLALRSSIGFFLQIPFFFAAYHFLSHFPELQGVSFMGLRDLASPDAAISLGGFSINVMPLVMTAINLASALIYTHNLTRRDKLQLYGMAAVFLVLLYDAASGLVLYWTCNNIYSLAKNIVYQELGRMRRAAALLKPRARAAAASLANLAARAKPKAPGKAVQAREDGSSSRALVSTLPLVLWGAGAAAALISSNQVFFIDEAVKTSISLVSDIAYILGIAAALAAAVKLRLWRNHAVVTLLALVIACYGLLTWGKWFFLGEHRRLFSLSAGILFLIPALGVMNAGVDLKRYLFPTVKSARSRKPPSTLLVPAGIWLCVLLAAYLPVQAYTTAPEVFSPAAVVLAKSLMWTAMTGACVWVFGALAQALGAANFAGYLLGAIASVLTVYAFLLPLDVGTIDAFQIEKPEGLFRDANLAVDLAVVTAALALFALAVKKGGARLIKTLFIVCTAGALANGTVLLWNSRGQWKNPEAGSSGSAVELPDYTERLFGFSKTGENIVVVMLDSFTGTHAGEILKYAPDLKEALDGFTWYVDNVSAGGSTVTGLPALICGRGCTPAALNAAGDEPLAEKINARYGALANRLGGAWDISLYERNWLEPMRIARHTDQDVLAVRFLSDAFLDRYVAREGITIGRGDSDNFLLAVSVFSAVPWSSKNLVYKNGRWFEAFMGDKKTIVVTRALRDWSLFEQLPEVSNARAQKSTFKFIDTELTHSPWFMELGSCKIVADPKRTVTAEGLPEPHLATEICSLRALGKWFDWMRREGVWDNTTVVLAADHSAGDDPRFTRIFEGSEMTAPSRANSLMLIKPKGAAGTLVVDPSTPMSPARAAGLWTGETFADDDVREHFTGNPQGSHYIERGRWQVTGPMNAVGSWKMLDDASK